MSFITVTVYIRTKDLEKAREALDLCRVYEEIIEDDERTVLYFHEVRNGVIENEECALIEAGIPFDTSWDGCNEFNSGTSSFRFLEDGTVEKKIMSGDGCAYVLADDVLKKLTNDQVSLAEVVSYLQQCIEHQVTPSWDNQDDFAQRYLSNPDKENAIQLKHPSWPHL